MACCCSSQAGRTPQQFQGIFPPSAKSFCLFNFPLLRLTQFKELILFELESTSSGSRNVPHKGDGFLGNRNVARKKKNPWKPLLPTSFPSAPQHCCLPGTETTTETRVSAVDQLTTDCKVPLPAPGSVSPSGKRFSCEMGLFS